MKNLCIWPLGIACLLPFMTNAAVGVRSTIELSDVSEVRICWDSLSNFIYQVQYRSELDTNVWIDLGPPVTAAGPRTCVTEPVDEPRRFFRVVGPDMVWISPGTFTMGSPPTEPVRWDDESPQTEVTISRGFWMGKYEVTQAEYGDVVGGNPSYFRNGTTSPYGGSGGPVTSELRHPVESVSWSDATNYCGRLTERERSAGRLPPGYVYRLPTEAEWEYACRAGTTTPFPYGNELRSGMANFRGKYEYPPCGNDPYWCYNPSGIYLGRTTAAGSYAPNAWGLYDMHGNVWEWCLDWYGAYPGESVTDPQGPGTGSTRVFRGGSGFSPADYLRSASRNWDLADVQSMSVGFRAVLARPLP